MLVKEYKESLLLDSFAVFVHQAISPYDEKEKNRSASILRTMNINYRYEFIVAGQKPYELKDMKMTVWPEETANSDGYGCIMGDFTLDNVKFKDTGNPRIIKHDSTIK